MKLQQLLSFTRRAIDDYAMIDEGDKIAIGVSGGKDSMALLYAMHGLMRFYPKKFCIQAITVDLGFHTQDVIEIKRTCEKLGIPYTVVTTDIANIIFEQRKESSPCSLCAKMRKGALNDEIKRLGCNKVAYGHHKDDVIETMLLSMIYEGRFHSFAPKLYLDRMDLHVIRPFIYLNEADIIGFINKNNIPIAKSKCVVDGYTKRQYAKELLKQINTENPGAKNRMFGAIANSNLESWIKP